MSKDREKKIALFIAMLLAVALSSSAPASAVEINAGSEKNTCRYCHGAVAKKLKESVHADSGVTCTDCHGGDDTAIEEKDAMSPEKGFTGRLSPRRIPDLCNKCHGDYQRMRQYGIPTDQYEAYKTSVHGVRLLRDGDENVAQCASCHGTHNILKTSDQRSPVYPFNVPEMCGKCHSDKKLMSRYGLSGDEVADYGKSIHGKRLLKDLDTAAPSCASCHGNHGAAPPGVDEVVNICGKCHTNTRDYFVKSRHYAAGMKCVECHGNHRIEHPTFALYSKRDKGGCLSCHRKDGGGDADKYIAGILETHSVAEMRIKAASRDITKAQSDGMEVDPQNESLQEAKSGMVKTGPVQHQTSLQAMDDILGREVKSHTERIQSDIEAHYKIEMDKKIFAAAFAGYIVLFIFVIYSKYWILKRHLYK